MQRIFDKDMKLLKGKALLLGNSLWIVLIHANLIVELDINTEEIKLIKRLPEKNHRNYQVIFPIAIENKIYLVPNNAQNFWCYNILSGEFECIDIGLDIREKEISDKFSNVVHYKDQLYLIGKEIQGIISYNINTRAVIRYKEHLKLLENKSIEGSRKFLGKEYLIVDNTLYYAPFNDRGVIISFDLEDHLFKIYNLEDYFEGNIIKIEYIDNEIRLTNSKKRVIFWKPAVGLLKEEKLDCPQQMEGLYTEIYTLGNKKLYIAIDTGEIYFKDEKNLITKIKFKKEEDKNVKLNFLVSKNKFIVFQLLETGEIYKIDLDKNIIKAESILLDIEKLRKEVIEVIFGSENIKYIKENNIYPLEAFIRFLEPASKGEYKSYNIGEKIKRYTM